MAPFCSCPASLVSRKFFAVGPGCAKCFFFVALRRAPRPFGGARAFCSCPAQKKKTLGGVFFFALAPCRLPTALLLPLPFAGAAALVSRKFFAVGPGCAKCFFFAAAPPGPGWCLFFCCGPARTLTHSRWAAAISARPGWCFFFLLRPRRVFLENSKKCPGYYIGSKKTRRGHSFPCLSPGPEQKKKKHPGWCFFFCSGPVPASNGASPSLAFRRGRSKKNTLGGVFFFCSGPVPASNGASPSLAFRRGRSKKKKNTLGGVFFLLRPRADAHSLTAGLGGDASPSPGRCFFFCCGPARTGVVFFFCCGPARTLTHSRWAGAISARPGWCFFFAAAPPGLFRE